MIAYSRSRLLLRARMEYDDGSFVEMVIWRVPVPVPGSIHEYEYRLSYGREGERLVVMTTSVRREITGMFAERKRRTHSGMWNRWCRIFWSTSK